MRKVLIGETFDAVTLVAAASNVSPINTFLMFFIYLFIEYFVLNAQKIYVLGNK